MTIRLDCFGATHVGRVREENEDQFLIADLAKSMRVVQSSLPRDHETRLFGKTQGKLLIVADGMGGHASGERASLLAIEGIATYVLNTLAWYFHANNRSEEKFTEDLRRAMLHCQDVLQQDVDQAPQRRGMGTTLTMAYITWPLMYVVHVGDSRCYIVHKDEVERLTRDHTVGELYRQLHQCEPNEDGAMQPRISRSLWNVIGGGNEQLSPDVCCCRLEAGDTVFLCTDGLTAHLTDEELGKMLLSASSAQLIANNMIQQALAAGGTDNITAIVARFSELSRFESAAEGMDEIADDEDEYVILDDTLPMATPPAPAAK
jgi:protein phosphatase